MSFEGYMMRICHEGHLWRSDVYDDLPVCPYCAEEAAWEQLVDETNGQGIEPALVVVRQEPMCPTCRRVSGPAIYRIPGGP